MVVTHRILENREGIAVLVLCNMVKTILFELQFPVMEPHIGDTRFKSPYRNMLEYDFRSRKSKITEH